MKNTAEVIKGISMMVEGLSLIKNALSADIPIQDTDTADVKAVYDKPEIKVDVTPETPETVEDTKKYGNYTLDELRGMSYNAFKKAAATIGVKCTGTRDEIMSRILALDTAEEVEEETPIKSKTAPKQAKTTKPVEVLKEEPKKDEYDTQAEQIVKSTDKEEIIAALEDVGIEVDSDPDITALSDLTALLAKALREGLLETEDEDDPDESESEEEDDELDSEDTADDDEEEITPTSYFPEYDEEEYNNPDEMTTNRKKAVEKEVENILADYDNGDLTEKEIMVFLTEFCTDEELDLVKDADEKEQLKLFIEMSKRFIDNDGEKIEPNNPYELGEHDMCCGHELKYNKKSKTYICEHCGEEYEAE